MLDQNVSLDSSGSSDHGSRGKGEKEGKQTCDQVRSVIKGDPFRNTAGPGIPKREIEWSKR